MSGGGGDNGYEQRQATLETQKQASRDRLNVLFGEAPTSAPSVDKNAFYKGADGLGIAPNPITAAWGKTMGVPVPAPAGEGVHFDQAGYEAAVKGSLATTAAEAAKNKAGREKLYTDIRTNAYTAGKRGIDDQTGDAKRNLKFELFAKGLNGGSTDIDQNARLQRTYDQGILGLGAKSDGAAADVRSNDESTRLGLLQSIDAGLDQGSAISSALAQMRANSDKASSSAAQTSVDDLFGNAGLLYQMSKRSQGEADARSQALFNTGSSRASNKTASAGMISKQGYT